jgi:Uma2 family endonuclease
MIGPLVGAKRAQPATYEDLCALPENVIGEIIGGELYAQPRPGVPHTIASSNLGGMLFGPFRMGSDGPGGWIVLDEPELHLGDPTDVLVPDLAGWRRERMPEAPSTPAIRIPPDWVCEILSPSTALKDRSKKLPVYARERVQHVWLIDPDAKSLEVLRLSGDVWQIVATYGEDQRVRAEPFEAIELDLAVLWAR